MRSIAGNGITKNHWMLFLSLALLAPCFACSDDPPPPSQDLGYVDLDRRDIGRRDLPVVSGDLFKSGDSELPWPDQLVRQDATQWPCVPEEENMCGGDKNHFCDNSLCTQCPADYKDCDRIEGCECFGGCKGDKCGSKQ